MSNMVFQAAVLRAGKTGVIKPDAAGYYTMCIGGLDIENAAGVVYAGDKAKNLFSQSSDLQRRIRERSLRGELGHPERTSEFAKDTDWLNRLNDIRASCVSTYWSSIELDETYGRNNPHLNRPNMIGIIGRFRPGGAHGAPLTQDLADPEANVAFSIRAFSIQYTRMGQRYYDLQNIITWDQVIEPGIDQAKKTLSATMETRTEQVFTDFQIRQAIAEIEKPVTQGAAVSSMESRSKLMRLASMVSIDTGVSKPSAIYYNWK